MTNRIDALARRVEGDDFFLASALADYARSEGLDEHGLAAALGCPTATLGPLRLCRRPRPAPAAFRDDIDSIATRFAVRADVLSAIVRRSDALSRLRRPTAGGRGLLMAARDRDDDRAGADRTEGEPG